MFIDCGVHKNQRPLSYVLSYCLCFLKTKDPKLVKNFLQHVTTWFEIFVTSSQEELRLTELNNIEQLFQTLLNVLIHKHYSIEEMLKQENDNLDQEDKKAD